MTICSSSIATIDTDSSGNIVAYCSAPTGSNYIQVFDSEGNNLNSFAISTMRGFNIDSQGRLIAYSGTLDIYY